MPRTVLLLALVLLPGPAATTCLAFGEIAECRGTTVVDMGDGLIHRNDGVNLIRDGADWIGSDGTLYSRDAAGIVGSDGTLIVPEPDLSIGSHETVLDLGGPAAGLAD